tara:strand:+ start:121 stop:513 length:393 start_codon:yes stop_codon:yes gene_type:complete
MGRVFFNTRKNVHELTGTYQILASDSGKVFMLNGASGFTATLPTIEAGLFYKFIAKDTTADVVIAGTAGSIDLVGKDSEADLGPSTAGTAVANIHMELAAHEGTYINLYCDGTGWYAESMGSVDASVTTS